MTQEDKIDRLNHLADSILGAPEPNFVGREVAPFDIKQVNLHENKKEFLEELQTVSGMVDHSTGILILLARSPDDADPVRFAMLQRVQVAVDGSVRHGLRKKKLRGATANDLVIQNFRETGFFENSLIIIAEMAFAYQQRLEELQDQKKQFWSMEYRAPHHYARSIALRFARFFARQTLKRPTFGTSSLGRHPSTDFGRALEKVFEILEISANLRGTATWALKQLTEPDDVLFGLERPVLGAVRRRDDKVIKAIAATMVPKGS